MKEDIIGHTHQRDSLRSLLGAGRLPTTMLFAGPKGIGKFMIAKELAQSLFCKDLSSSGKGYGGCSKCRSCQLFELGNLPDLHIVECSQDLSVASIRELLYSLNLAAFSDGNRVVIFNDADYLSIQGANILLKSLEEPGKDLYFILVASNPSRLPNTILSRCQILFFDSLTSEQISKILDDKQELRTIEQKIDRPTINEISLIADGSIDNIDHIMQHLELWNQIKDNLAEVGIGNINRAIEFSTLLTKDKESLPIKLALIRGYARLKMHEVQNEDERFRWATLLSNIIAAENLIFERNIHPGYLLNWTFTEFSSEVGSLSRTNYRGTLVESVVI